MKGHGDAEADKKTFGKMLKKAMPKGKVTTHLKSDIKEAKHGIKKDKKLIKKVKGY